MSITTNMYCVWKCEPLFGHGAPPQPHEPLGGLKRFAYDQSEVSTWVRGRLSLAEALRVPPPPIDPKAEKAFI